MCAKFEVFVPCKKIKKGSRSKQQVLSTTSSSQLTVETTLEGQSQTVQWVMVHWPPVWYNVQTILRFGRTNGQMHGQYYQILTGVHRGTISLYMHVLRPPTSVRPLDLTWWWPLLAGINACVFMIIRRILIISCNRLVLVILQSHFITIFHSKTWSKTRDHFSRIILKIIYIAFHSIALNYCIELLHGFTAMHCNAAIYDNVIKCNVIQYKVMQCDAI